MLLSAVQNSFLVALYMEIKCRKVYFNMCRYVRSLTDPIEEHKETMSLDLDFKHCHLWIQSLTKKMDVLIVHGVMDFQILIS